MKTNSRAVGAMAGLMLCGSALADCEMRKMTAAEVQYNAAAEAKLKETLPPPPAGWTRTIVENAHDGLVCTMDGVGGWAIQVSARYVWRAGKEESERISAEQRKLRKDIDNLRDLPPEVKKERQVWLDKMSEANRASNAAYKAGDKALASQKNAEGEGYSQKGRAIRDAYWQRIQPEVDKLEARLKTLSDVASVTVLVVANEKYPRSLDPYSGKPFAAGKVPLAKPGLKLEGVRLIVTGQLRRGEIEALVDQQKLNRVIQ